jgi:acetylornithine deacetylase
VSADPVALTQALVSIPSVNPELEPSGTGEAAIARYCARWLAERGFQAELVEAAPGRFNVVARHRGVHPGPSLLLNGHLDTVGVAGMSVAPFEARLVEGRIQGRGACDMKAGVAALMTAATRVTAQGHAGELIVALTCDEEHASVGMASLVEGGLRADAAIVCEPTGLAVMPAHKGFVWCRVTFRGRAAHGSRPEAGVDAIRHAGRFLVELDVVERTLAEGAGHPLLGHGSLHAGTIAGGTADSIYPDRCVLTIERRTLPGESPERARMELESVLATVGAREPALDAQVEVTLARPATEVATEHPLVQGLLEAVRRQGSGIDARIEGMTAWVDAAFLNDAGVPAVCFGPGSIEDAHRDDEAVDAREVALCAEILTGFAGAYLGA